MTNPTPRPALRKAADAEVHPAAPRPARSARASAAAAEPVPSPRPAAEPTSGRSKASATSATKGSSKRAVDGEPTKVPRPTGADDAASGATGATAIGTTPRPRSTTTSATRSARSRGLRPVPPKTPETGKTPRRFSGSTSDHLRPEAEPEAAPTKGRGGAHDGETTKQSKSARSTKKQPDLMKGKSTELDVTVPKALRKAARSRAKAEGLDLDTVVIDLLHDWVTRRR